MLLAWILNALALAAGALLGVRGLLDPKWAQKLVRLKPDEQRGGFAEFRATYGGLFAAMHAAALLFTLKWIGGGEYVLGVAAAGASATIAAAWAGACFGRLVAMWRDGARTRFNEIAALIEAAMALLVGGPWLLWLAGVR
jgi:hypothetical protein